MGRNSGVSRKWPVRIPFDDDEVAILRSPEAQRGAAAPGSEGTPLGVNAAERLGNTKTGSRGCVHHQTGLVAILGIRRSGDQLHGLNRVRRYLRGEDFALLIADGLPVDHKGRLCMVSQRMKEAIGVGCHPTRTVRDGLAQLAARIESRQLQETAPVNVLMRGRFAFHHGPGCFHIDGCHRLGELQRDVHGDRQGAPNVDGLRRDGESGSDGRQLVVVLRDIVQAERPRIVGYHRLLVTRNGVAQRYLGAAHNGARRVGHGAGEGAAIDGLGGEPRDSGENQAYPEAMVCTYFQYWQEGLDRSEETRRRTHYRRERPGLCDERDAAYHRSISRTACACRLLTISSRPLSSVKSQRWLLMELILRT